MEDDAWSKLPRKVFTGRNVDLGKLASLVESYLASQGYTTQRYQSSDQSYVVQARKGGLLRALVSAQRAFTIHISGNPQNVVVNVGVANWGQDIAVDAIETVLFGDLSIISDAETLWNLKIEREIMKEIQRIIESGQADYTPETVFQPTQTQQPQRYPPPQFGSPQYGGYAQQQVQPQKVCAVCGASNPTTAVFCGRCGSRLS